MKRPTPPPFDAELQDALPAVNAELPASLTLDMALERRRLPTDPELADAVAATRARVDHHAVPTPDGASIVVTSFRPHDEQVGPGILFIHGGGMVMGDRTDGVRRLLPLVDTHAATIVAVGYRLAPEHPHPTPLEDCVAALGWLVEHADSLGVDRERVALVGESAGGGLAAAAALLVRDRGGPRLSAQMLLSPMLDDRDTTVSAAQVDGIGIWDRSSNVMGWTALLGTSRGTDVVSEYAAPARATDLSGLPATYIEVGSVDVFRDEDVAFASRIWQAGGVAELHVWPGAFHGFDGLVPAAAVTMKARATREAWLRDALS